MYVMHSLNLGQGSKPAGRIEWRRILQYFAPYWRQEVFILVIILFTSALGQLPPLFTKWIIDGAIAGKDLRQLLLDVGGMVGSALLASAIGGWQGYLNAFVGEGIMRDMRDALVTHLHSMPLSFFTSTKTGEIMNRVSSDVDNIEVEHGDLIDRVRKGEPPGRQTPAANPKQSPDKRGRHASSLRQVSHHKRDEHESNHDVNR